MSQPSLAGFVLKRDWLKRLLTPMSNWYTDNAGYRKLGLRADDLIPEENEVVQRALKRLSPKEAYDRVFRMRRAFQLSLSHTLLPKNEWTNDQTDTPYLSPLIKTLEAERTEREDLETMTLKKPTQSANGH